MLNYPLLEKQFINNQNVCRRMCDKTILKKIMMIGATHRLNPTVHVPPWFDQTEDDYSPLSVKYSVDDNAYYMHEALTALQRYLPSNDPDIDLDSDFSGLDQPDSPVDAYSCDHFRMFDFKVRRCARGRSHDWTECPYAHPGEKARRRDPRKYHYSGTACPDFRKGNCKKGDACEFAHGVFECWLHPARYRTQPCKDGSSCRRRVCFFAHTPEQLRVLPQQSSRSINAADSYDGSPLRQAMEASFVKTLPVLTSSRSMSPPASPLGDSSPPISPMDHSLGRSLGSNSIHEMVASLRNFHLGKVKSLPSSCNMQFGCSSGFGSNLRPGFCSLPTTPTRTTTRKTRIGYGDIWEKGYEEEPVMERVESGRDLRARMFHKLSKENRMERVDPSSSVSGPDVEWISDLVE